MESYKEDISLNIASLSVSIKSRPCYLEDHIQTSIVINVRLLCAIDSLFDMVYINADSGKPATDNIIVLNYHCFFSSPNFIAGVILAPKRMDFL